jgi:hypothetical protein
LKPNSLRWPNLLSHQELGPGITPGTPIALDAIAIRQYATRMERGWNQMAAILKEV